MKKTIAFLFCVLFAWGAVAQENKKEPFLPPMDDYKSLVREQSPAPRLRVRGMSVDDGYGTLSPYGAASLFGGTPAYEDYSAGMRYATISYYTLWTGVGLSAGGALTMIFAATNANALNNNPAFSDPFFGKEDFWSTGGGIGLGLFIAGIPLIATGATFTVKAKKRIARAVDIYNEYTGSTSYNYSAPELSLGFTPGGVGMVLKF